VPRNPAVRKTVNRFKTRLERRHSPVRHDQSTVPMADAIRDYWHREALSFAIPAHGGGRHVVPEAARWTGTAAFRADLPISHGLDTRDRAWAVQQTAQELFAVAVGADLTLFSTNGSSMSAHVAILAVAGPGERIVMARNGHKSAFAGLVMSGAEPVWVRPEYDADLELTHGIAPDALRAALDGAPDAKATMIFTPTYYGVSSDVGALAELCHERGLPLVTDDAWGLDYSFSEHLPASALSCGADLAIGSVHKTLTGLGQTSVLSVKGDLIDVERLQRAFELEESTSTSALLLSSIDGARAQFVREGRELMDHAAAMASRLRDAIATIDGLDVVAPDRLLAGGGSGAVAADATHVIIELGALGLTGYEADDWLRDAHAVDVELADHRRLMALVAFAHDEADIDRLAAALRELATEHAGAGEGLERIADPQTLVTEQAMSPRDAFFAASEMVAPDDAVGRINADIVTPYPPGIPVLAPGEVITAPIIEHLEHVVALGGFVEGATDQALDQLRVVARP
jgi:arginine/lysine/ornithine decarboxylase